MWGLQVKSDLTQLESGRLRLVGLALKWEEEDKDRFTYSVGAETYRETCVRHKAYQIIGSLSVCTHKGRTERALRFRLKRMRTAIRAP